jgi:hypothetical protein
MRWAIYNKKADAMFTEHVYKSEQDAAFDAASDKYAIVRCLGDVAVDEESDGRKASIPS